MSVGSCDDGDELTIPGVQGLDLVPLQPDLGHVGSSDLASRITWVHANLWVHGSWYLTAVVHMILLAWKAYRSPMKSLTLCKYDRDSAVMIISTRTAI